MILYHINLNSIYSIGKMPQKFVEMSMESNLGHRDMPIRYA